MSLRDEGPPDPSLVLKTYPRILLSEFVTVVLLSVLTTLAALSIVPIGAALLSMLDTFHASVSHTGTGGGDVPTTAAGRASYFMSNIWTYLRAGLPYTVAVVVLGLWLYLYISLALGGSSLQTLVVGVVGMYGVVIALVLLIRSGEFVVRADAAERPGFLRAIRQAWGSLTGNLAFGAIHIVVAVVVTLGLLVITPVSVVFLLPGMLVLLELLVYEELDGAGAKAIRYAYLDPQS